MIGLKESTITDGSIQIFLNSRFLRIHDEALIGIWTSEAVTENPVIQELDKRQQLQSEESR